MMTSSVALDDGVDKEATWRARSLGRTAGVLSRQAQTVSRDVAASRLRRCQHATHASMTSPRGKLILSQTRNSLRVLINITLSELNNL